MSGPLAIPDVDHSSHQLIADHDLSRDDDIVEVSARDAETNGSSGVQLGAPMQWCELRISARIWLIIGGTLLAAVTGPTAPADAQDNTSKQKLCDAKAQAISPGTDTQSRRRRWGISQQCMFGNKRRPK